jgi:hypothetical protein
MDSIFFTISIDEIGREDFERHLNNQRFYRSADGVITQLREKYPSIKQIHPITLVNRLNDDVVGFSEEWVGVFFVEDMC